MRVMDIGTTTMQVDYQQHSGAVISILFTHDGKQLFTVGVDGNLCSYDVTKNYLPTRMFTTYRHQPVAIPPSLPRNLLNKGTEEKENIEDSLSRSMNNTALNTSTRSGAAAGKDKEQEKPKGILHALAINGKTRFALFSQQFR